MIKMEIEPEECLPQVGMMSTEIVIQPQVPTRKYARRPRREAFSKKTLKRKIISFHFMV